MHQLPIRQFEVRGQKYGLICGKESFIVTENDFVHALYPNDESVSVTHPGNDYTILSLKDIAELSKPLTSLRGFGHYWGIKDRVGMNYFELMRSMREIGADVGGMPEWGKEWEKPLVEEEKDLLDEINDELEAEDANGLCPNCHGDSSVTEDSAEVFYCGSCGCVWGEGRTPRLLEIEAVPMMMLAGMWPPDPMLGKHVEKES